MKGWLESNMYGKEVITGDLLVACKQLLYFVDYFYLDLNLEWKTTKDFALKTIARAEGRAEEK